MYVYAFYETFIKHFIIALNLNDSEQRPSSPSTFMYDWLSISLLLREMAVDSRKRRSDIYSRESNVSDSTDELDVEENEEEEEIVLDS